MKALYAEQPLTIIEGLSQYERASPGQQYVITADVARGKGLDFSTFNVFDITEMPYKQVAVYKDNLI